MVRGGGRKVMNMMDDGDGKTFDISRREKNVVV